MGPVIAYVASPDFELNLYISIHSLFQSESEIKRVKVFSVGGMMPNLERLCVPVEVEEVENRNEDYFLENKTYISEVNSEKVIYLDCDTLIIRDINKIWKKESKSFISRRDSSYESGECFRSKSWDSILSKRNARKGAYFNSGFVGFRKGMHKRIGRSWRKICKKEYDNREKSDLVDLQGEKMIEQMALSISVLRETENIGVMDEEEHVYGWEVPPESVSDSTVVYHTGSRGGRHLKYAMALARRGLVDFSEPVISSATHPLFLKLQAYSIAYRVKEFLSDLRS